MRNKDKTMWRYRQLEIVRESWLEESGGNTEGALRAPWSKGAEEGVLGAIDNSRTCKPKKSQTSSLIATSRQPVLVAVCRLRSCVCVGSSLQRVGERASGRVARVTQIGRAHV